MILFLDFDGVLHPDEVYIVRGKDVVLRCDGHNLFEYAELLIDALMPYPDVRIVLSTSWVHALSLDEAKARLPEGLQSRVTGATYYTASNKFEWNSLTRYQQIMHYVHRYNVQNWLAIDNDASGWPEDKRHHLVHTDDWGGLGGTIGALDDLQTKLKKIAPDVKSNPRMIGKP